MQPAAGVSPRSNDSAALMRAAIAATVLVVILLSVFWNFFVSQGRFAINQQADWGHTLVIPFMAGYLVYASRDRLLARPFRTNWLGFLPILLGIAWYTTCAIGPLTLRHHNLMGAGVALTLFGLVLLFFGLRATLVLLFPLAFLVLFGQTISDRFMRIITFRMQDITAWGAEQGMILVGFDINRQGNMLTLFHQGKTLPLNVAEACSGMRMLMAFLALGVFMGYTGLRHNWQRVTLVVLALPTAIFVNVLRVITLALLGLVDANFTAGDFHTFVGLVWLVPAMLIYLGLMWILRRIVVEPAPSTVVAAKDGAS